MDIPVNAFAKAKPVEWPITESDEWVNRKDDGTLFVYCNSWPDREGRFEYVTYEPYVDDDGDETTRLESVRCLEAKVHLNQRDGVITFKEKSSGDKYAFDIRECVMV